VLDGPGLAGRKEEEASLRGKILECLYRNREGGAAPSSRVTRVGVMRRVDILYSGNLSRGDRD